MAAVLVESKTQLAGGGVSPPVPFRSQLANVPKTPQSQPDGSRDLEEVGQPVRVGALIDSGQGYAIRRLTPAARLSS
jgi:hypothetical protein